MCFNHVKQWSIEPHPLADFQNTRAPNVREGVPKKSVREEDPHNDQLVEQIVRLSKVN